MATPDFDRLPHVTANLAYTAAMTGPARVRIFPPTSGRKIESPRSERIAVPVYDCRPLIDEITLDVAGFEVHVDPVAIKDFYDADEVREKYYPLVIELIKRATGAIAVFPFDHNVRSRARVERGDKGVREPVDGAHNDYTVESGPRRVREILEEHDAMELAGHRAALINAWRPIVGPVQDFPLTICDARSATLDDFIPTAIEHYLEGDLEHPHLTGQIYSFKHSPGHRWFYLSDMQPDEIMLLKCFDSAGDGRACFTGHTGFRNPACPPEFVPRESIEVRTAVIYP